MVKLYAGEKGTGKSKAMVKRANERGETAKGNIIYIDDDNRAMYELSHKIRFINIKEFPIQTIRELQGFVCGLISNNYDIESIYIDGIMNSVQMDENGLTEFFFNVSELSNKQSIQFEVTLNTEGELPPSLQKYC